MPMSWSTRRGDEVRVPGWLAAQGIDLPVESWDCGLIYYTRHYRMTKDRTWPVHR